MLTLSSHFPLDFPGGDFNENGRKQLLLHFFVFRPGKLPEAFKGKVFFMAAKKTIFHQIISCKNTLHGVSKEAKRRRKIRTILKLYNIWHKKVGTKLFSSSLKKRQFTSSKNALFSLKFEVFFDDFQTVSQMRVKVWKWLPVNLEKSELAPSWGRKMRGQFEVF